MRSVPGNEHLACKTEVKKSQPALRVFMAPAAGNPTASSVVFESFRRRQRAGRDS